MINDKDSLLRNKVEALAKTEQYETAKVSSEGYGSFIPAIETVDSLRAKAKSFREEADLLSSVEAIPLYIESIICYLKWLAKLDKQDPKEYILSIRYVLKLAEYTASKSQNHKLENNVNALNWLIFNLKIFKISNEYELLSKAVDENVYAYMLGMFGDFKKFYDSESEKKIEIVSIKKLAESFKKRL